MTTFLSPARWCFAHRGAASPSSSPLKPFFLRRGRPGPISSRFLTSSVSSPCRPPPRPTSTPTPRPRFTTTTFRRHQSTPAGTTDSLPPDWKSTIWRDGYYPNYIATQYDRIPSSYTDAQGLRFAGAELTQYEIRNIFGSAMSATEGNKLLKILHGRRVAGTLSHPEYLPNTAEYSQNSISAALAWLRRTLPVDETLNGALRAEEELAQIEEEQEEEKRVRAIKRAAPAAGHQVVSTKPETSGKGEVEGQADVEEEANAKPVFKPDPIYGYSALDELRFNNQQKNKKIDKQLAEERKARLEAQGLKPEQVGTIMALDPDRIHLPTLPKEMSPRMKEYQRKGMVSQMTEIPELPIYVRLVPSTIFALSILCLVFVANSLYTPPKESERLMPEIPFAVATMPLLVMVNLFIFIAWHTPPCWNFLNRFFILVPSVPRAASILLSGFSHQTAHHLWSNMAGLVLLGIPLCDMIGRADFMSLVVGAAVIGNLSSLWFHVLTGVLAVTTQGISAVVCAFCTMYFYLNRNEHYRFGIPKDIFGLPDNMDPGIPGYVFIILFMLHNCQFISLTKVKNKVDATNHWAGIFVGLAAGKGFEYKAELKRQRREERRKLLMGISEDDEPIVVDMERENIVGGEGVR